MWAPARMSCSSSHTMAVDARLYALTRVRKGWLREVRDLSPVSHPCPGPGSRLAGGRLGGSLLSATRWALKGDVAE